MKLLMADIAETQALQQVNIASNSNIQRTSQTQDAGTTGEPVAAPPSEYYPEPLNRNVAQSDVSQPGTTPAMPDFGNPQQLTIQPAQTYESGVAD